jgi:hypothetical protein
MEIYAHGPLNRAGAISIRVQVHSRVVYNRVNSIRMLLAHFRRQIPHRISVRYVEFPMYVGATGGRGCVGKIVTGPRSHVYGVAGWL